MRVFVTGSDAEGPGSTFAGGFGLGFEGGIFEGYLTDVVAVLESNLWKRRLCEK